MSTLAGVFDGLETMGLPQLLLAFVACMAFVLAQGRLLGRAGRCWAAAAAFGGAAGFVVMDAEWASAIVLVAVAVAGLGAFTAIVWLTTRAIGFDHTPAAGAPVAGALEPEGTSGWRDRRPPTTSRAGWRGVASTRSQHRR